VRTPGHAVFDRQGQRGDAAPGGQGLLSVQAALPAAARRHDLEVPGHVRPARQGASELGFDLLVHKNPEAEARGINPFDHGSALHTDIWKTEGLKQALAKYGFDAAFGGARRDEEKSRAKERVFSFRSAEQRWDPKNQRPELWKLYNTRKHPGESLRVFPISNWTELDVWQYIHLENIPIVPLYFAAERPVVERDGVADHGRRRSLPPAAGEVPQMKSVRFRTLGCYPLTGAVESTASTLPQVIQEMLLTTTSSARAGSSTTTSPPRWRRRSRKAISRWPHRLQALTSPTTSTPIWSPTSTSRCCASSPAAASTTASRP
jgi:sulfate adenylyltransferase small subunit